MKSAISFIGSKYFKMLFKLFLQYFFKISSFHLFLLFKAWDILYSSVVIPWLSAHEASSEFKRMEKSRQIIWNHTKNTAHDNPHKAFKKMVADMWAERNR